MRTVPPRFRASTAQLRADAWRKRCAAAIVCNDEDALAVLLAKLPASGIIRRLTLNEGHPSLLAEAAREGRLGMCLRLLEAGAPIGGSGRDRLRPLAMAVDRGHFPVVRELLKRGAPPNDDISPALGSAIFSLSLSTRERMAMVELLLANGADPNGYAGFTRGDLDRRAYLMEEAAMGGLPPDIVEVLLAAGGNPLARTEIFDTPWTHAVRSGAGTATGWPLRAFLQAGCSPNTLIDDQSSLERAVRMHAARSLELLLEHGANVHWRNRKWETLLIMAVSREHSDQERMVRRLLQAGIEIDAVDQEGDTALHAACYAGNVPMVRILLEAGADPTIVNRLGCLARDCGRNPDVLALFAAWEARSVAAAVLGEHLSPE